MNTTTYIELVKFLETTPSILNKILEYTTIIINEKPQVSIDDMEKRTQSQHKKKSKTPKSRPVYVPEEVSSSSHPPKKDLTRVGYDKIPLICKKDLHIAACIMILGMCDVRWGDICSTKSIYPSSYHNTNGNETESMLSVSPGRVVGVLNKTSPHLSKEDITTITKLMESSEDILTRKKHLREEEPFNEEYIPLLVALLIVKQSYKSSDVANYQIMKPLFDDAMKYVLGKSLFLYISFGKELFPKGEVISYTPRITSSRTPKITFHINSLVRIEISDDDIVEEIQMESSSEDEEEEGEYVEEDDYIIYSPSSSSTSGIDVSPVQHINADIVSPRYIKSNHTPSLRDLLEVEELGPDD